MNDRAAPDPTTLLLALAGHADVALRRFEGTEEARRLVHEVVARADRDLDPHPLDVNRILARLEPVLRDVVPADRGLTVSASAPRARVVADRGELQDAILALVRNAAEATHAGGSVVVETANVRLPHGDVQRAADDDASVYVVVTVTDNGRGIAPDEIDRALEPLYTTKEGHSGIGLPVAVAVARQLGGDLVLLSEPGSGTAAKLYLPLADHVLEDIGAPKGPQPETVLVVDDTEVVLRWTREVLEHVGYHTLAAGSGAEALEISRLHDGPIDLVVSDIVMPGIDGIATIGAIAEQRPETRFVLMSGYADTGLAERGVKRYGAIFLQKPFSIDTLCTAVRESLEAI